MKWRLCKNHYFAMVRYGAYVELTSLSCIVFTIFPYCLAMNLNLTWYYDNNDLRWLKNVASCVWVMNNFVPTCNINNYREFNNFLAARYLQYVVLFVEVFIKLKCYVYLQQTPLVSLDVVIWHIILQVWKVLPSKILLLERWDDQI